MPDFPHLDKARLQEYQHQRYAVYDGRNRMMGMYSKLCDAVKYARELSLPDVTIHCELIGKGRDDSSHTKRFALTLEQATRIAGGPGGHYGL